MRRGSANLRSPERLKNLRRHLVAFEEQAHLALRALHSDVNAVLEWLEREQLPRWRRLYERRHLRVQETWRAYIDARHGDPRMGKPSCVDERKAWERAKREKEEAAEKIRRIERWLRDLPAEAERILPPCLRFEGILYTLGPQSIARVDRLLDDLDEYFQRGPEVPKA